MPASSQKFLRFGLLAAMIVVAAFSRIIPHLPNFSPLGAIGLFGAAYFSKKWQALLVPVAAIWLSDLFINNVIYAAYHPQFTFFYNGFYWQYGTYLLITIAGFFLFRNKVTVPRVLTGALTATLLFYLITNFACWPGNPAYTQDFSGLMTCYAAGLPFIKGTLLGDLFYSGLLFGVFALLQQRIPGLQFKTKALSS